MGNNEEKRENDDKEKISQRERDALEDTVIRSYKKTKALFEKSDDYLTKIGMGDFVRDNNQELENSMIQFRKSFTEYMEK